MDFVVEDEVVDLEVGEDDWVRCDVGVVVGELVGEFVVGDLDGERVGLIDGLLVFGDVEGLFVGPVDGALVGENKMVYCKLLPIWFA